MTTREVTFRKHVDGAPKTVTAEDVARDKRDRMNFQKTITELSFDLLGVATQTAATDVQREILRAVQTRAEENLFLDMFDGFYTTNHIITPPVDPLALVEMVRDSTALRPCIDAMIVNVTGFGWSFPANLDLDDPDDVQALKDHVEGKLLHVLETDGVETIKSTFDARTPFAKSETPDLTPRSFLESALESMPILKFTSNQSNLPTALGAWKRHLFEYVDDHPVEFRKLRSRSLRSATTRMVREIRDEQRYLRSFFGSVNPRTSFRRIRAMNWEDLETVGWWTMEVVRDKEQRRPVYLNHVPVSQMRLTKLGELVNSWVPFRINDIEIIERQVPMRYRKYVQSLGHFGRFRWFREFGDERIMDSRTGEYVGINVRQGNRWIRQFYNPRKEPVLTEEQYLQENPGFEEATEILADGFYNPSGTPYHFPRWFCGRTLIQGLIAMEEVNSDLFDNQMIPPYFLFVTGGKLSGQSHERIRNIVETVKRGRANYRRVVVLEATSGQKKGTFVNTGVPQIEVKPMADLVQNDASHSVYDEKGRVKTRSIFRLTPAHTGQESQFTRQSINSSIRAGETQVFVAERQNDDDVYNTRVLPAMGINHLQFRTNSPPVADNLEAARVLEIFTKSGILAVGEVRKDVEKILNRTLPRYHDPKLNQTPFPLILIESKTTLGQKTDMSMENPEDTMGARPEKGGMAFQSSVIKSQAHKEVGISFMGDVHSVSPAKLDVLVNDLFEEHDAVWVRRPDATYDLHVRGEDGLVAHTFEVRA